MHWWFGMDFSSDAVHATMGRIRPSHHPLSGLNRDGYLPSVLPNEADEQPKSAGGGSQSADASKCRSSSHYFRAYLPQSARGSNHLHGGFVGHEDRDARNNVPNRDGDAGGGGGTRDRGRRRSAQGRNPAEGDRNRHGEARSGETRKWSGKAGRWHSEITQQECQRAETPSCGERQGPNDGKTGANGKPPTNGKSSAGASASNGNNKSNDAEIEPAVVPKEHPRSRSKRTRKAR